ncbi:MAG: phosphatase PAP2 family protein [Proteobacteria bacterium]|nr:phosphatase PAP2 family protein [Pseudomonadota bacterium]
MKSLSPVQRWLLAFAATVVAVVVCDLYIDRPIVQVANRLPALYDPASLTLNVIELLVPLLIGAAFVAGVRSAMGRTIGHWGEALMLAGFSIGIAVVPVEAILKRIFCRVPVKLFLKSGSYGFYPFHGGFALDSFPSGHTTFVSAGLLVLWIVEPRWRAAYASVIAITAICLILVNGHFFGDTVGGLFVGGTAAWTTVTLWRKRQ